MDYIYKQAVSFQNKFRQYLNQPNHEIALQLKTEIQRLTDEIETSKNPRSIENGVKNIMQLLHKGEALGIMNHQHADDLLDICMELQQELRKQM